MVRLAGLRGYARLAREKLGNQLTAGRFAGEATANGPVPDEAVALFFAVGPENAYQFEQWRLPLEALATRRPVVVIVDRPDTGRLVLATSTLPVAFARASGELETLVERHRFAAVLYPNQVEQNFRMLRFAEPVHIQIGHGESDKGGSVSNQHKAYDVTFIGGPAGRERLARALYDFDADARIREVGRPQLDHDSARRAGLGRRRSAAGALRPDLGGRPGQHPLRVPGQPRRRDHRRAARRPSGADHLPAPPADRSGFRRARCGRRPHPGRAGRRRGPAPDRPGPVRLAVAVRRPLHHRRVRGGVRLAGDREAAGDHRAGRGRLSPAVAAAGSATPAAGRPGGRRRARCCRSAELRSWPTWRRTTSARRPTARARDGSRRPWTR